MVMKARSLALAVGILISAAILPADAKTPAIAPLKCDVGPVTKVFGKASWLVYSCDDHRSVVVVATDGSPAMPFYFILAAQPDTHRLYGEGTGDKAVTDAAFAELKMLTEADIASLVAETLKTTHR
jgi:hypothetical protein